MAEAWAMRAWALVAALTGACTDASEDIEVHAATSLREVLTAIARDYEDAHPDAEVRLVFAGSQTLRLQAEAGARFDVFASAHPEHVERLHGAGLCGVPRALVRARLALVVPVASNLRTLEALDGAGRIVLGTAEVPVGRYADQLLAQAGARFGAAWLQAVEDRIVSREKNARLVRAKVSLGEADAAFVYETDAHGNGLGKISIPEDLNVSAAYAAAARSPRGEAFLRWMESPAGRARFEARGFLPP